jgi:hypothetical protein
MSYRRESQSEEEQVTLIFDVDPLLEVPESELGGFLLIYENFIEYKAQSADLDNIPCPSEDPQKDFASLVDLFGKDKPNEFPKPEAKKHGLHHIHVFDGSHDRELKRGLGNIRFNASVIPYYFIAIFFLKINTIFMFCSLSGIPADTRFSKI